jgi:pimeloyl-ACP methyl ester carboxylesterase
MTDETLHLIPHAGRGLAARHHPGRDPDAKGGGAPTLVFLPGLRSDMTGDKATALVGFGRSLGLPTLRLDYSGHGESQGRFEDGGIATWCDDALAVIDALAPGRVLLVGSSMGGWIGLLAGIRLADRPADRPADRLAGFVGIAAAPDFTRAMAKALNPAQNAALDRGETIHLPAQPDPLPLTRRALDEGEASCVMHAPIALTCPVRLLHGQRDDVVPWRTALAISDRVTGQDCRVILVKDGDHRLSRPRDIALLCETVGALAQAWS